MSCGHCVAACPTGALSHRAMTPEQCAPIKPELSLTAEQAEQFLRGRRSIRAYRSDPVDQAVLARLIGTASAGPSGHNTQPVEWLIIRNTSEVGRLTGMVIDWMRFMIQQKPDFAKALLLEHVVSKWEQGIDAVQLELSQLNYMDEDSFEYLPAKAANVQLLIAEMLQACLEHARAA